MTVTAPTHDKKRKMHEVYRSSKRAPVKDTKERPNSREKNRKGCEFADEEVKEMYNELIKHGPDVSTFPWQLKLDMDLVAGRKAAECLKMRGCWLGVFVHTPCARCETCLLGARPPAAGSRPWCGARGTTVGPEPLGLGSEARLQGASPLLWGSRPWLRGASPRVRGERPGCWIRGSSCQARGPATGREASDVGCEPSATRGEALVAGCKPSAEGREALGCRA